MAATEGTGCSRINRLITKLTAAFEEKKFYEGHQLLITVGFRLEGAEKYEELEELLVKYAGLLLEQKQNGSGMDVAVMLSKLYTTASFVVTEQRIMESTGLLWQMPDCTERETFILDVVKWALAKKSDLIGPFHAAAARIYIKDRDIAEAWLHALRVNDANEAADITLLIISRLSRFLRKSEVDLVIAHRVLAFVVLKKLDQAETVFVKLVRDYPVLVMSPLLNGVRYLIKSAKMNDARAFKAIRELYQPSFARDPLLLEMVDKAEKSLFALPNQVDPQAGGVPTQGFFGVLRSSILRNN